MISILRTVDTFWTLTVVAWSVLRLLPKYSPPALRCTSWWGHKYEARYDRKPFDTAYLLSLTRAAYSISDGGDTYRVYVQDVCVRCGDVIERPETVK